VRVLVTGGHGQLGPQFARLPMGEHEYVCLGRERLDITQSDQVRDVLSKAVPDLVVHCAAWTDVDGCEREPDRAYQVTAEGTRILAEVAAQIGSPLVYISTDFVFDGTKPEPYNEDDSPNPINVYGRTKLAGEEYVRDICRKHYIIRTAWLFGLSLNNFVGKILRAARSGVELRVTPDEVGSPTAASDLAARIMDIVGRVPFGTYHLTNSGDVSRYAWARQIVQMAGLDVPITPIPASEWLAPARRPANSRLENRALQEAGFSAMRPYQEPLAEVVPTLLDMLSQEAEDSTGRI